MVLMDLEDQAFVKERYFKDWVAKEVERVVIS